MTWIFVIPPPHQSYAAVKTQFSVLRKREQEKGLEKSPVGSATGSDYGLVSVVSVPCRNRLESTQFK